METNQFTSCALIGHIISCGLMAKLVDRGVISSADAASVSDDALLQLEEFQSGFPEYQAAFEEARVFLEKLVRDYRTNLPRPLG
jgi:hypothetical protein